MNIAFFHGLESSSVSEKTDFLHSEFDSVYAPEMDYRDPALFDRVLQEVKERNIDLLVGSSMGGWFAFCISTLTGIPTLLFNPAVHSRSIPVYVRAGKEKTDHTVVLGSKDEVVNPQKTLSWFEINNINITHSQEDFGHRIPIDTFKNWLYKLRK